MTAPAAVTAPAGTRWAWRTIRVREDAPAPRLGLLETILGEVCPNTSLHRVRSDDGAAQALKINGPEDEVRAAHVEVVRLGLAADGRVVP